MTEILQYSHIFCTNCGELLDYRNLIQERVICKSCSQERHLSNLADSSSQINIQYQNSSEWKNKLYNKIDQLRTKRKEQRKVMEQDCPKACGGREVACYEMQLRSADEGSTVFYECLKCGHGYIENN